MIPRPASDRPPDPMLDFCVIGAQKSGTTTLFELLRTHPELCLPADKEAPFFNRPELAAQGPAALFRTYFPSPLPHGRRFGTVTPHYMCEPGCAKRLAEAFPACRLVAILRDPVERAHSQHRMATRRELERRPFADAVAEALVPEHLEAARRSRDLAGTYVAWSEYGRVLADYLRRFESEQLLVVFTDDLARDPQSVLARIHSHLGVAAHTPEGIGRRYHEGGSQRRLPGVQRGLARSPLGWAYRRLPTRTRARIFMRVDHWNVRREPAPPDGGLPPDLLEQLRAHFGADEAGLHESHGLRLPWAA